MKLSVLKISGLVGVLFSLLAFSWAQAQIVDDNGLPSIPSQIPGLQEQISIDVFPEHPAPNQDVTISIEAFGTDLNRANISWLLNGSVKSNGVGDTSFSFTSGNAGTVTTVTLMILPENGSKITKDIVITPASVDIAWEPVGSYTPPFYKGKSLYPHEGNMTLVALPNFLVNGVPPNPNNLVYKWSEDDTALADHSGYGKNTFSYISNVLDQPVNISVEASTLDGSVVGVGSVTVNSIDPQIFFYEDNPLYGLLFNNSLSDQYTLKGDELKLAAFPYYFSASNKSDLTYEWIVNNSILTLLPTQSSVVFRKPPSSSGQSSVYLDIKNSLTFLQTAANSLMINWSTNTNSNVNF